MFWKFELDYIFRSKAIGDFIYCDFIRICYKEFWYGVIMVYAYTETSKKKC